MKDICTSLFARSASADTQPRGGKLLLAQPFMDENYFSHSVVSLLDYDPKGGAMGVVLNHPSPSRLADLVDDCDVRTDIRVYCGGPLALDRLFFLHTLGTECTWAATSTPCSTMPTAATRWKDACVSSWATAAGKRDSSKARLPKAHGRYPSRRHPLQNC